MRYKAKPSRKVVAAFFISDYKTNRITFTPTSCIFMKKSLSLFAWICLTLWNAQAQNDEWHLNARQIDPSHYFGITVANGMIGLVSSPEPMKVKDVVLNRAYDNYLRGRVSNILKKGALSCANRFSS